MALYDVKSSDELLYQLDTILTTLLVAVSQVESAQVVEQSVQVNSMDAGYVRYPYIQDLFDNIDTILTEVADQMSLLYLDQACSVTAGQGAVYYIDIDQAGGGVNGTFEAFDVYGNVLSGAWNGFVAGDKVLVSGADESENDGYHVIAAVDAAYLELTTQDFTPNISTPANQSMSVTLVQRDH